MTFRPAWLVPAFAAGLCLAAFAQSPAPPSGGAPIKVLFLGHDSEHHPSARLFPLVAAPLVSVAVMVMVAVPKRLVPGIACRMRIPLVPVIERFAFERRS